VNPLQVTILRWYEANEAGPVFGVVSGPSAVAFDGANIWVTSAGANTVTKLRAADGDCLFHPSPPAVPGIGSPFECSFPVGNSPQGIAYDGASIWVANSGSNNVTKLLASDGAVQGTFGVGDSPVGIAFDGANIWVTNNGDVPGTVSKLQASDGATITRRNVGASPVGIAFDGANMWIANSGSSTLSKR